MITNNDCKCRIIQASLLMIIIWSIKSFFRNITICKIGDALTKRPPTKRPVNISPQTKCPLNILPQVTFCPSDIWNFMGWIVRPLFTPSFLPWKWYAQSQCDISSLCIMASPNLVTFCLSNTVSPPYDSSTQVRHDVHPVTCCPSCDTMSSLWHFFLTGTLYLFWYSLSTLNILPILLHFHLCNTLTILWHFVYFSELHHNWPIYPENLTGHRWE